MKHTDLVRGNVSSVSDRRLSRATTSRSLAGRLSQKKPIAFRSLAACVVVAIAAYGQKVAAAPYVYTFTGTVTSIPEDAAGIIADAGITVGTPVSMSFLVDFAEQGYVVLNDGSIVTPDQWTGWLSNYDSFYTKYVAGALIDEKDGGTFNGPSDLAETHIGSIRHGDDDSVINGLSQDHRVFVNKTEHINNWVVGTTGILGREDAYDANGNRSRLDSSMTLTKISQCGNGQLDAGEDCDDGGVQDGDCCSSDCAFETPFSVCMEPANVCVTSPGICDGSGVCVGQGMLDCSDSDLCTDDSCDPVHGCMNSPRCVDGDLCTIDRCDPGNGACSNEQVSSCQTNVEGVSVLAGDPSVVTALGGPAVPGGVQFSFNGTEGGIVNAEVITANIEDVGPLTEALGGFNDVDFGTITEPVMFWEFSYTGTFSPPVSVVIGYDDASIVPPTSEADLKIFHFKDGAWSELDRVVDTVANTITFDVDSFSFFGLGITMTKIPVTAKKLVVVDKVTAAGKAKAVFVAKDGGVTKGGSTDPDQISVRFHVVYGDGSAAGAFTLPAGASVNKSPGWVVNKDTVAKYVNKEAPLGPTGAKVAVIKPTKLLKLVGKSLGDTPLDILGAGDPGVGGVQTAYCVTSGPEEDCHCSTFPVCSYKVIAGGTGAKLVCKNAVADPACTAVGGL